MSRMPSRRSIWHSSAPLEVDAVVDHVQDRLLLAQPIKKEHTDRHDAVEPLRERNCFSSVNSRAEARTNNLRFETDV